MPQPKIRSNQFKTRSKIESGLGGDLIIENLSPGHSLQYTGYPLAWRNAPSGSGGMAVGDGLRTTAGAGSPFVGIVSTDSTVARTNVKVETFGPSINLNDSTQAADSRIWRISNANRQFLISTRTGTDTTGNDAVIIKRTGTTVDSVVLPSSLVLNASGVGSSAALQLTSKTPTIQINSTNATANQGVWEIAATNELEFRTRTDTLGTGATWLTVKRSGTTVSSINFVSTSFTVNGISLLEVIKNQQNRIEELEKKIKTVLSSG